MEKWHELLVNGQLHAPAALPLGKERPVPIGYRAGWGHRAGLGDMEKWTFLTIPGLELQPLCHPARSHSLAPGKIKNCNYSNINYHRNYLNQREMSEEYVGLLTPFSPFCNSAKAVITVWTCNFQKCGRNIERNLMVKPLERWRLRIYTYVSLRVWRNVGAVSHILNNGTSGRLIFRSGRLPPVPVQA
jgi:hypothetical protein